MDPVNNPNNYAKFLSIFKDIPVWLFAGIAISCIIFISFPELSNSITQAQQQWVIFTAILFGILAVSKLISSLILQVLSGRGKSKSLKTFFLTPINEQSFIHIAKQPDGTINTQIAVRLLVKNLTNKPLYLTTATIKKPKISGEHIQTILLTKAPNSNLYGSAHVSKHFIPPQDILPVSIDIMIKGTSKFKKKTIPGVVTVIDDEGSKKTAAVMLRSIK